MLMIISFVADVADGTKSTDDGRKVKTATIMSSAIELASSPHWATFHSFLPPINLECARL